MPVSSRSFLKVSVSAVLALVLTGIAQAAEAPRQFRAGAATSNITPPIGVSISGGMQDRSVLHIHDELHARCLVLDDGKTKLVIVVNDSCMIPREIYDEAKRLASERTDIPVQNILCSATHTHSAPTAGPTFQSDPDKDYLRTLPKRIADGIIRANNNLAPAKIGWGIGREPSQVFNRRWKMKPGKPILNPFGGEDQVRMNPGLKNPDLLEPAGPIDPEVAVLAVQSPDGKPIAVVANYSLHYVGGTGLGHVSADYFAAFGDRLQELLKADRQDPPFVAMMSNGTSGDVNNIDYSGRQARVTGPYAQIRAVGDAIATEAQRVYAGIQFHDWVPLSVRQAEISLGVRKPTPDELATAREIVAKAKTAPRMETMPEIYARETVQMNEYPAQVPVLLQAMRIGDLGITAIPCETFVEIGLELKAKSPLKPTFTISLANGYNGYLPTPAHHKLGGYETWRAKSSYLEVDASTKITAKLLELLGQLATQP
jgi:neutral ceramidase